MTFQVTRFACGHVGRDNEPPFNSTRGTAVRAFIRVAEARRAPVEESRKNCPDCGGGPRR